MVTAQKLPTLVNGVNVDNLFTTIDAIKATPTVAKFKFRIQNKWEGSAHNRSAVNGFYGAGQEFSRQKSFVLHSDSLQSCLERTRRQTRSSICCTPWQLVSRLAWSITRRPEALRSRKSSRRSKATLICTDFLDSIPTSERDTRESASTSNSKPTYPTSSCRRS